MRKLQSKMKMTICVKKNQEKIFLFVTNPLAPHDPNAYEIKSGNHFTWDDFSDWDAGVFSYRLFFNLGDKDLNVDFQDQNNKHFICKTCKINPEWPEAKITEIICDHVDDMSPNYLKNRGPELITKIFTIRK